MADPFRIVFVLYPRITQLDFTGPYEVLKRMPGAEILLTSKDGGVVEADSGLAFANVRKIADVDRCDMIMAFGGQGLTPAMQDVELMAHVRRLGQGANYIASVCTGSLMLAAAGLLEHKRAGCHWAYLELLELLGVKPDGARVVRDGNTFTGGGVTAGIDIALAIVAEISGAHVAKVIQLSIEYAPAPPFNSGHPSTAAPETVARTREIFAKLVEERREAITRMVGEF
jgi:transcriptional regulator GlxA family with amidase domain